MFSAADYMGELTDIKLHLQNTAVYRGVKS